MSKRQIATDKDGKPIYKGDTVTDEHGNEHKIKFEKLRDQFGFGYIYGFYIPDYCTKV
jgi:hypothetical protein